jgi:hypothetical protein
MRRNEAKIGLAPKAPPRDHGSFRTTESYHGNAALAYRRCDCSDGIEFVDQGHGLALFFGTKWEANVRNR